MEQSRDDVARNDGLSRRSLMNGAPFSWALGSALAPPGSPAPARSRSLPKIRLRTGEQPRPPPPQSPIHTAPTSTPGREGRPFPCELPRATWTSSTLTSTSTTWRSSPISRALAFPRASPRRICGRRVPSGSSWAAAAFWTSLTRPEVFNSDVYEGGFPNIRLQRAAQEVDPDHLS